MEFKELIILHGGPYDGEEMHVLEDQDKIRLPVPGSYINYVRSDETKYGFAIFKPEERIK